MTVEQISCVQAERAHCEFSMQKPHWQLWPEYSHTPLLQMKEDNENENQGNQKKKKKATVSPLSFCHPFALLPFRCSRRDFPGHLWCNCLLPLSLELTQREKDDILSHALPSQKLPFVQETWKEAFPQLVHSCLGHIHLKIIPLLFMHVVLS